MLNLGVNPDLISYQVLNQKFSVSFCSNSCNLFIIFYSNSPMQRSFSNTRVGMHCTGCSFTSQIAMQYLLNISDPAYITDIRNASYFSIYLCEKLSPWSTSRRVVKHCL